MNNIAKIEPVHKEMIKGIGYFGFLSEEPENGIKVLTIFRQSASQKGMFRICNSPTIYEKFKAVIGTKVFNDDRHDITFIDWMMSEDNAKLNKISLTKDACNILIKRICSIDSGVIAFNLAKELSKNV